MNEIIFAAATLAVSLSLVGCSGKTLNETSDGGSTGSGGSSGAPPPLSNCDDATTPVRLAEIDSSSFEVRGTSMLVATESGGSVRLIDLATRSVRMLAAGRNGAYALSMSAKFAYWLDTGPTQGASGALQLVRAPLDGSSPAENIARVDSGPTATLVDGDDVYFGQVGDLAKISESGGLPAVAAVGAAPLDLAVAGDHIYWATCNANGEIQRMPKAGGSVETIAQAFCPFRISTDETDVFFLALSKQNYGSYYDLWRVPLSGGEAMLISSAAKGGAQIPVDETYVYLVGEQGVSRIPKSGGAAELVEKGTIGDVAVDKSCLYWKDNDQRAIFVAKK